MTPELIALSRRLVACEGFRWMPGMKVLDRSLDIRVHSIQPDGLLALTLFDDKGPCTYFERAGHKIPDLSDPATLGCLLALVREAYGNPYASTCWHWEFDANNPKKIEEYGRLPRRKWAVDDITDWDDDPPAFSEAEALVCALESARRGV